MRIYLSTTSVFFRDLVRAVRIYLACAGSFKDYHAMKVYLAVSSTGVGLPIISQIDPVPPPRMLLSYHYFQDADVQERLEEFSVPLAQVDVFADSGAFSAATLGVPVDPQKYIEWCLRWGKLFTAVAAPDVIGDAQATATATESMLKQAPELTVLPVFHVGEPWEFLDHWAKRSKYLALGGMVPFTRQSRLLHAWLQQAFSRIPSTVKVHGFGLTTFSLLKDKAFPWYSVDSSSWTTAARYGVLLLFNQRSQRLEQIDMRKRAELMKHREVLAQYRLKPSDVLNSKHSREVVVGASIVSWQRVEAWLTERNGDGGKKKDGGAGSGPRGRAAQARRARAG